MAGRIEWGRYGGDDVESVIAMMLNREHPDSVRIRPSQGDGGVDVLDRGAAPDGGDVVYQVKRYAGPLDANKRNNVRHSLESVLHPTKRDARWAALNVTQWRLVMPWDATPEADHWFHYTLLKDYTVEAVWDGLVVVDQLAAKYDDVIDYYLRDGKSAVIQAMENAMSLMSLKNVADSELSTAEVAARVQDALLGLDHDPHYAYEFRFGHGEPPLPPERPRMIMTACRIDPTASKWHAIDVLARCAESATERPITIDGRFIVEPGSAFAQTLQEFRDFGTPFTSPDGAYTGQIDAPGGLGGALLHATVSTTPFAGTDLGDDVELQLELVGSEGQTLATIDVDRTERSSGRAGLRVVLTETNDLFDLTMLFNLKDSTSRLTFAFRDPAGRPVAAVRPAIDFITNFRHPHMLRCSARHMPAGIGGQMPLPPSVDANDHDGLKFQAHILKLLADLQEHAATLVRVPEDESIVSQFRTWELATAVLAGRTATVTVKESYAFAAVLDEGATFPTDSFVMELPNEVTVGTQKLNLGKMFAAFGRPTQVGDSIKADGTVTYHFTTDDRKVRYSLEPPA